MEQPGNIPIFNIPRILFPHIPQCIFRALFINMDHKHGFVKRAANFPIERTLCIDPYRVNYVYQKMEPQGNIAYLWENKIIMILEHL